MFLPACQPGLLREYAVGITNRGRRGRWFSHSWNIGLRDRVARGRCRPPAPTPPDVPFGIRRFIERSQGAETCPRGSHICVATPPGFVPASRRRLGPRMPCALDDRSLLPGRFRRLPLQGRSGIPPYLLRLLHTSNVWLRFGSLCSARSPRCARLLWPRLTSAHLPLALRLRLPSLRCSWNRTCPVKRVASGAHSSSQAGEQISKDKTRDLPPTYPSHIRPQVRMTIGLRGPTHPRPPAGRLVCASCSSGQEFAYSFLQTSPRGFALAVRLEVPVIKVFKGLSPSSHFPVGFRLPVASGASPLRVMPSVRRGAACGARACTGGSASKRTKREVAHTGFGDGVSVAGTARLTF